jgi:predicted CxxxxCH...CXXCH cytochrome family protein
MNSYSIIVVVTVLLIGLSGCADLKSDLPTPSSSTVQVHEEGWATASSSNFHGDAIRANNWDMRSCKTCHGPLYDGGTSGVSCRKCHTDGSGPENCATCHGTTNPAPPRDLSGNTARTSRGVGAHQIHLMGSSIASTLSCKECHTVPGSVYDPGHIDGDNRAEVPMNGALARTVTNEPSTEDYASTLPTTTPSPSYDFAQFSCANTYCHGNFKNGNNATPVWNSTSSAQAACGTCHGDVSKTTLAEKALPKSLSNGGTHPDETECYLCHDGVVDANLNFINPSKHIDGKVNVFGVDRDF